MLALRIALLAYFNAALQITQLNKLKKVLGFTLIKVAHFAFLLLMQKMQRGAKRC
jgi:multisubunit Na+/H+ antiporter MnhC subunit